MNRLFATGAPASVVLVRLFVGVVFLSEGVQKFMLPDQLGVGRFTRIGIPWPGVSAPFVGSAEILCGALIILGFLTRPAALVMLINISVALVSTKLPILLGHAIGPFTLRSLPRYGLWSFLHESRTDLSMWLGSLFLAIVGAGRWSLDALVHAHGRRRRPIQTG